MVRRGILCNNKGSLNTADCLPHSPGRFFAANELKAMLAFIVLNYDLKLANDTPRPANVCFAANLVPDPNAEILFRRR